MVVYIFIRFFFLIGQLKLCTLVYDSVRYYKLIWKEPLLSGLSVNQSLYNIQSPYDTSSLLKKMQKMKVRINTTNQNEGKNKNTSSR